MGSCLNQENAFKKHLRCPNFWTESLDIERDLKNIFEHIWRHGIEVIVVNSICPLEAM